MQYLYGLSDTKYHREETEELDPPPLPKFRSTSSYLLDKKETFNRAQWSIDFRVAPASLVELCVTAVDRMPPPSVFKWTNNDIRRWIRRYGFPQYMNTFRVNMIWGRKLLLLDANALCAMNIKDFDHIKRITYGIRMLFHFELTKFSSSISLPDEKPYELYLLWHTQTGINYDRWRCSDLLQRMQVIRERSQNLGHWDLLDLWLHRERARKQTELLSNLPRLNLYSCRENQALGSPPAASASFIWCESPFDCITDVTEPELIDTQGSTCIPPCECRWPSRYYLTGTVLRCLKLNFPQKFAPTFRESAFGDLQEISNRWTRFSI